MFFSGSLMFVLGKLYLLSITLMLQYIITYFRYLYKIKFLKAWYAIGLGDYPLQYIKKSSSVSHLQNKQKQPLKPLQLYFCIFFYEGTANIPGEGSFFPYLEGITFPLSVSFLFQLSSGFLSGLVFKQLWHICKVFYWPLHPRKLPSFFFFLMPLTCE